MWWFERIVALPCARSCAAAPLVALSIACGSTIPPATSSDSTSTGASAETTTTTTTTAVDTSSGTTNTEDGTTTTTSITSAESGVVFDLGGVADLPVADDTSTGDIPIDCDSIPQGPLPYTIKTNIQATEDLAFDDDGNLIGSSGGSLFRTQYDANPQLWVPNAGVSAGLRATSEGMIVFAGGDNLSRINDVDAPEIILGGLSYPNGMDVDLDGFVYVAEQSGSRVRRIDSQTGDFTVLAEGLDNPNGVSFSPDYSTLYVGSFGGGTITAIHLDANMEPKSVEPFYVGVGGGALDGMAVDACGNVYVCEFVAATVWRITPDGSAIAPLVELGNDTSWIPNMQWGSGVGGWDRNTLYVLDFGGGRVFEVPVEVTDKPRGYP